MIKYCEKCQYDYLEGQVAEYDVGNIVFLDGENLDYVYFINEGYLKMVKYLENGDERIIGVLGPGDYLALLAVLQNKEEYIATAIPITAVILKKIPKNKVLESYNKSVVFKEKCMKCAVTRSNTFQNYLVQSANTDVKQKILDTLLTLFEKFGYKENKLYYLDLPFSKTVLANLIGIRRETLSRYLSRLQAEEILKVIKNKYILYYVI